MVSYLDAFSLAARKAGKLPDRWFGWLFTSVEPTGLMVKGAVCPDTITRGPRKGRPNFRTCDRTTVRDIYITQEQIEAAYAVLSEAEGRS